MDACRIVGNDSALVQALGEQVCDGVISGVACVLPELLLAVYRRGPDFDRACRQLDEFIGAINGFPVPWALKWIGESRGIAPARFGQPLSESRVRQGRDLRSWFERWRNGSGLLRVTQDPGARPVIFYDGVCRLCNGMVQFVLRHDPGEQFDFAPLQGEFARRHSGEAPPDSIALLDHGQLFYAGIAVLRILARLQAPWPLVARLVAWLPRPVLAWGYRVLAKHRYRLFGRYESCALPPPGSQTRFK